MLCRNGLEQIKRQNIKFSRKEQRKEKLQDLISKNKILRFFALSVKKLQKMRFVVHPLFIIVGVLMAFLGQGFMFCAYTLCVLIHELGHMLIARKLGYFCARIKLMPFGAVFEAESDEFCPKDEILIAVTGPLVNLVVALIIVCLWWVYPNCYYITCDFAIANLVCGVFNLVPIFPLDGGRVVLALISKNFDRKLSVKIVKIITIIFAVVMFVVFCISLVVYPNFSIGVMSVTLLFSAFSEDKNTAYKKLISLSIKRKKLNHGLQVKEICVSMNLTLQTVFKKLSFNHYNFIYILDDNFKILGKISESDLNQMIERFGHDEKIYRAIKMFK